MGNKFLEKKDIHKLTWASEVDDCERLRDLIVVQEEKRNKLLDGQEGNVGPSFIN